MPRERRALKAVPKAVTLKELREAAGFKTQAEAAIAAGLDQTTIGTLERGKVPDPRVSTVDELARVFACSRDEVIAAIALSVQEAS